MALQAAPGHQPWRVFGEAASDNAASSSYSQVRGLKNNLSRYLDQVEAGVEIVVTDRGGPIARLNGITDEPNDKLAALIEAGLVRPPTSKVRQRPVPLRASGSVSELVAEQRE